MAEARIREVRLCKLLPSEAVTARKSAGIDKWSSCVSAFEAIKHRSSRYHLHSLRQIALVVV